MSVAPLRLATVLAAVVALSVHATPGGALSPDPAAEVIALTNKERARQRLPALDPSPRLIEAAQLHAEQMARFRRIDHVLPEAEYPRAEDRLIAVRYPWRAFAENIAFGQANPAELVRSWLRSKGHRTNILNATVTEIGVGRATDAQGRLYWVQLFGRPASR